MAVDPLHLPPPAALSSSWFFFSGEATANEQSNYTRPTAPALSLFGDSLTPPPAFSCATQPTAYLRPRTPASTHAPSPAIGSRAAAPGGCASSPSDSEQHRDSNPRKRWRGSSFSSDPSFARDKERNSPRSQASSL